MSRIFGLKLTWRRGSHERPIQDHPTHPCSAHKWSNWRGTGGCQRADAGHALAKLISPEKGPLYSRPRAVSTSPSRVIVQCDEATRPAHKAPTPKWHEVPRQNVMTSSNAARPRLA